MPPPGVPEKDIDGENNLDLHLIGLWDMIEDFNSLAADDTDLDTNTSTYTWTARTVCNLFDITSDHWIKEYHKRCLGSLNE